MCVTKKLQREKMFNPQNFIELIRQMTVDLDQLKNLKQQFDGFEAQLNVIKQEVESLHRGPLQRMFKDAMEQHAMRRQSSMNGHSNGYRTSQRK